VSQPVHCPACAQPAEPGQLVCLRCGSRIALAPRRRRRGPRAATAVALVALGALVLGFALGALADNGDDDASQRADAAQQAAAREQRLKIARRERQAERRRAARAKAAEQARSGTWPADLRAYTVVLVTSGDEADARQTADEAKAAGLKAGVLRSDDYDLGQGFWIVYSGTYDDQDAAATEAGNLTDRYPGAYPQLVDGS
jgi:predicted nucleic acid-binding Zn ribbon protein